jgi:hypothetical protein
MHEMLKRPFRAFVAALLSKEPELLSLEILRRARLDGCAGGKSAMYALVTSLRPPPTRPVVRFEGLPAESLSTTSVTATSTTSTDIAAVFTSSRHA